MSSETETETEPRSGVSRRTVLRTTAWSTPVIATVTAAPSYAASQCTGTALCPNLAFGTPSGTANTSNMYGGGLPSAGNGWSANANSGLWSATNTNRVGFETANGVNRFIVAAEPTTTGRIINLTQTGQPALKAGCAYTLSFQISEYIGPSGGLTIYLVVGATTYEIYTSTGKTASGGVYRSVTPPAFSVPQTAAGAVGFRFTFATGGNTDDLILINPVLTCANTT